MNAHHTMIDKMILDDIRQQLIERREEMMKIRREANRSWQRLHEPAANPEEAAGKENLSRGFVPLEERRDRQVRQIDYALTKIDQGGYGICEGCDMPISIKRLKAIPWAQTCFRCAKAQNRSRNQEISESDYSNSIDGERTDEEIRHFIIDGLEADGRVELQELDINCEDGVIYLEGVLPSQESHKYLRGIVSENFSDENVVDQVSIDRRLWQNRERASGDRIDADYEKKAVFEGEEEIVDTHKAMKEGKPMQPPDRIRTDREKA